MKLGKMVREGMTNLRSNNTSKSRRQELHFQFLCCVALIFSCIGYQVNAQNEFIRVFSYIICKYMGTFCRRAGVDLPLFAPLT